LPPLLQRSITILAAVADVVVSVVPAPRMVRFHVFRFLINRLLTLQLQFHTLLSKVSFCCARCVTPLCVERERV
jgi:hypothetical protein